MKSSLRFLALIFAFMLMVTHNAYGIDVAWKPISATTDHWIEGNQILVPSGGTKITLEFQISNWGNDNGANTLLTGYQIAIDLAGFTSGTTGSLGLADIPCINDDDCHGDLTCGRHTPGFCDTLYSNHPAVFVDENHPSYVFTGLENLNAERVNPDELLMFAVVINREDAVADSGADVYGGTLILDVSDDALGRFTIDLLMGQDIIFLNENTIPLAPVHTTPAQIIVSGDCNHNGRIDYDDIRLGSGSDCNNNFILDACETDCNRNRIPDDCDILSETSPDCNGNDIPDECDSPDCNENQVPDNCDINSNYSIDVNTNDIPDECENDCNGNNIPDTYEIVLGNVDDCNNNLIPDGCDITLTAWLDCNNNGFIDDCDIAGGFSPDNDGNCIPDECLQRPRPQAEPSPLDKSRYIAFTPARAGCLSAIRITLRSLYHPVIPIENQQDFSAFENEVRWVGPPNQFPDSADGETTFTAAETQCDPYFGDWQNVDILHVFGDAILPNSLYEVQMVGSDCIDINDISCHSGPLQIYTGQWCDVTVPYYTPFGSSQPDIGDVLAIVNKWLGNSEPRKTFAQLQPNIVKPGMSVGIADILAAVDAWLGSPYPYPGPTDCSP